MSDFEQALDEQLLALRNQGLYRVLRRIDSPQSTRLETGGERLLNFSSNDYLGLANEPEIREAAIRAVERFGAGSGASRLLGGSLAPHHELEETLADFEGTEAALSFSSGYATALGTLGALVGRDDLVVVDKLVHACLVDAARLCGARLRVFRHNHLDQLEDILKWASARSTGPDAASRRSHTVVVTESVFSMDGDQAPLREIAGLKDRYGAWLMVDEAHATGLYGARGRGLAEASGVAERIEIRMGTLGKAVGSAGGFICGSARLIDWLVNRARSFIFTTAPPPAAAAAAAAGIRLIQTRAGAVRRASLWQRVEELKARAPALDSQVRSAILPVRIGDENAAVEAAAALRSRGLFVPAIRYPTVARGKARLRVTLTSAHSSADVAQLADALRGIGIRH